MFVFSPSRSPRLMFGGAGKKTRPPNRAAAVPFYSCYAEKRGRRFVDTVGAQVPGASAPSHRRVGAPKLLRVGCEVGRQQLARFHTAAALQLRFP